ncbi:MAG: hypothetical protein HC788_08475 [Sphingopyxis sp.]|nr:hypothetical protein [Sphingopyxis sp.]
MNTYILWAHHGMPSADQGWLANHSATREMFQAREDQISGTFTGRSLEEEMDANFPGWLDEYFSRFGDPPQKIASK